MAVLTGNGSKPYLEIHTNGDCEYTSVYLSKKLQLLFVGTSKGSIRVYLWPILNKKGPQESTNNPNCTEYAEFFVHSGRVSNICLSADKKYLMTASEDGSIYMLTAKEIYNGVDLSMNSSFAGGMQVKKKKQQSHKSKVNINTNQLSLVFRSAIESKTQ
jgi:WD40 repeat protein